MGKKQRYKCYRCLPVILASACLVMYLAGCGQDEAVSADMQLQGDPIVVPETGDSTEDTVISDDTATEETEGSSVTAGSADSAIIQDSTASDQKNAAEEQIEIDEETRQQLMTELLEENGLDASVVESEKSTKGCTFDIPEGFEESQETDNLYVTARYPLDTSMIYYEVMDGDISLQLMTQDMFREQVEEGFRQTYGDDIEVSIDSYESVKISGYPAFRILCHYEADDIRITQLEYLINADKTYAITYSQTSDYDWMEAFEESAATISVK